MKADPVAGWRVGPKALLFPAPIWAALAVLGYLWIAAVAVLATILLLLLDLHRGRSHLLRQALRSLVGSRQLAAISVVCITLSVAGASVTLTVHDSLDGYSEMQSGSVMGSVDLVLGVNMSLREEFHLSGSKALLDDLRGLDDVASANPIVLGEGPVLGGHGSGMIPNTGFMGVYDDAVVALGGFTAPDGRVIYREPDAGEVFVNPPFLSRVGVQEGDYIFLMFRNLTLPLQVSETVTAGALGGYGGDRPFIFINMNTAGRLLGQLGTCNAVAVGLGPTSDRNAASAAVGGVLDAHPELPMGIARDKAAEAYRSSSVLEAPATVLLAFGVLSLVLGMAVLNNLYRLMMEDRRQDLHVLRSLGLSRKDIILTMMDEGLALGGPGAVLGTVVGIGLSAVCLDLLSGITVWGWGVPIRVIVEPATILSCVLLGVGSVLLVAYISARSVLGRGNGIGGGRPMRPALLAFPPLAAVLYVVSPSASIAVALISVALLLVGGYLLEGVAPIAGPSLAVIVLATAFLTEGAGSYSALGSALLVTGVVLAGSLVPLLLSKRSGKSAWMGVRARLAIAYLTHPMARLRSPLLTFSSIFILLTVTTGLSGMAIAGTERTMDQGSWGMDSMALRSGMEPFEADLWSQVNRTHGALERQNISTMVPVFMEHAMVTFPYRTATTGSDITEYPVYGLDRGALSFLDMPLSEYDEENFSSPSEAWEGVLNSSDLAIVDSNLRYEIVMTGREGGGGIRPGDAISIQNEHGQKVNVTVMGITDQRLISGIFVGRDLMVDFFEPAGPTIYLIDYAPGLDSMEQDLYLERDMYSYGVTTINLAGKARDVTEGMADATLAMHMLTLTGLVLGVVGAIALYLRSVRDRRTDIASLRSIGMRRGQIETGMLVESALLASVGLAIGLLAGALELVGIWAMFLMPLNMDLQVDWPLIMAIDAAAWAILIGTLSLLFHFASGYTGGRPER